MLITTGSTFTDIDAYASALAYAQLRTLKREKTSVLLVGKLNYTITPTVLNWKIPYVVTKKPTREPVVLIDISDPTQVAAGVEVSNVITVYDHRSGYEEYWSQRLQHGAHIELVGACATLIWEEFVRQGVDKQITVEAANLLSTAILSNTLQFQSSVTTQRDKQAYAELAKHSRLPDNWMQVYYEEQLEIINSNPIDAMVGDTKIQTLDDKQVAILQLELTDASDFIAKHVADIRKAASHSVATHWFFSAPSITEQKNYLYTEDEWLQQLLNASLGVRFENNKAVTDKLWLRKEIIKKITERII
jgi:inorganic pyrophosphatase/exopolyphosphatase